MPRSKPKLREDVAEIAYRVMQEAIGERPKTIPPSERTEKNREAVKRGRKGGKARAAKLSHRRLKAIGRKAAKSRWKNRSELSG
jgi:hypothetical protein